VASGLEYATRGFSLQVDNFRACHGEIVGITGANGTGKTTLMKLLTGLVRPRRGDIRIESATDALRGADTGSALDLAATSRIHDENLSLASTGEQSLNPDERCSRMAGDEQSLDRGERRSSAAGDEQSLDAGEALNCVAGERGCLFGILPQESEPLDGTLEENVSLFDPSPDPGRLQAAAATAGLTGWIDGLPAGWQTPLSGGRAVELSRGQLQRLGLARLLYRDAAILVLDEPEGRLDATARKALSGTLARLATGRIVVVITHDHSLLTCCNRLYEIRPSREDASLHLCVERRLPGASHLEEERS
jgi:ABC-type transport system involved in cytochrome bd biosynthesis fused ATPase/permease subunit